MVMAQDGLMVQQHHRGIQSLLLASDIEADAIIAAVRGPAKRQETSVHQSAGEELIGQEVLEVIFLASQIAEDSNAASFEWSKRMVSHQLREQAGIPQGHCQPIRCAAELVYQRASALNLDNESFNLCSRLHGVAEPRTLLAADQRRPISNHDGIPPSSDCAGLVIASHRYRVFGSIRVQPIDAAAPAKILELIECERPLNQIPPFWITGRANEVVVSRLFRFPGNQHGSERIPVAVERTSIAQVKVLASLNEHRPLSKSSVLESEARLG
jgi:hypothetical protein